MFNDSPLRPDPAPDAARRAPDTRFGFLLASSGLSNLADGVLKVALPLAPPWPTPTRPRSWRV
ncbi:hypothetical protein [Nocardiopsis sp. CNR-923]|uniref:hypothetical protein n=1 Tax=Nocardiopsis sp. CNR-923 TaxID=1904965 RepID=UPI0029164F1B|nr:hypothetical protein [Nocardiopsis sp. CNR-923]